MPFGAFAGGLATGFSVEPVQAGCFSSAAMGAFEDPRSQISENDIRRFLERPDAPCEVAGGRPMAPTAPAAAADNAGLYGRVDRCESRMDRLEACVQAELRAVLGACQGCLQATESAEGEDGQSRAVRELQEDVRQLQAASRTHAGRLQLCASLEDLAGCPRQGDWLSFQESVEQRFGAQMQQLVAQKAELAQANDSLLHRCTGLGDRLLEQKAAAEQTVSQVVELSRDVGKLHADCVRPLQDRLDELAGEVAAARADIAGLADETGSLQDLRKTVEDSVARSAVAGHDAQRATEELQAAVESLSLKAASTAEEARASGSAAKAAEGAARQLEQRVSLHEERTVAELRAEARVAGEVLEKQLRLALQDVQQSAEDFRGRAGPALEEVQQAVRRLDRQLAGTADAARVAAQQGKLAKQASDDACGAVERAGRRVETLEARLDDSLEALRRRVEAAATDLREELRGTGLAEGLAAFKEQQRPAIEELRQTLATLSRDVERAARQAKAAEDQSRGAAGVAQEAVEVAQRAERNVLSLRGDRESDATAVARLETAGEVHRQRAAAAEQGTREGLQQLRDAQDKLSGAVGELRAVAAAAEEAGGRAAETAARAAEAASGAVQESRTASMEAGLARAEAARAAGHARAGPEAVRTVEALSETVQRSLLEARGEAQQRQEALAERLDADLARLHSALTAQADANAERLHKLAEEVRAERSADRAAGEASQQLSQQRRADRAEWAEALETHRGDVEALAAELKRMSQEAADHQAHVREVEAAVGKASSGLDDVSTGLAGLDSKFTARARMWDGDALALGKRVDALQLRVEDAKQGFAAIQAAFSELHRLPAGGSVAPALAC